MQESIRFASKFLDCQVDGFFRALEEGVNSCSIASWFTARVLFFRFAVILGLAFFFVRVVFFFF